MKVRMLTRYQTCFDGILVETFLPGQKYDLPEERARRLLDVGVAIEDKDMGQAPEIKDAPPEQRPKSKRRK